MQESFLRQIGRLRGLGASGFAGLLVLALIACAATSASRSGPGQTAVISDVRVEQDGAVTRVTLVGLDHPVFTSFQQRNPERVVIDLASVEPARVMEPVVVDGDLIEAVSVSPFSTGTGDSLTRVEIALRAVADYKVNSTEEGLEIVLSGASAPGELALIDEWAGGSEYAEGGQVDDSADPWAVAPIDDSASTGAGEEAAALATTWRAPTATTLLGVETSSTSDLKGSLIRLLADGTVSSATTFTLSDPDRLVVDLPNMKSRVGTKPIAVKSEYAARVRVGQHDGMVRVVVDAPSGRPSFDGRRVVPARDGLLITLGTGAALDLAVQEIGRAATPGAKGPIETRAPVEGIAKGTATPNTTGMSLADAIASLESERSDPVVAPRNENDLVPADFDESWAMTEDAQAPERIAPTSPPATNYAAEVDRDTNLGSVKIYAIEYSAGEAADRILVFGERPVDYLIYEPDPGTLVLSIERATIDPDAEVRIAPEEPGPVSLVTSFIQPDVAPSEVRVVVKRAAGAKPEIHRKGNLLILDFARDGGIADRPPLLAALDAAAADEAGRSQNPHGSSDSFPAAIASGSEAKGAGTASVASGPQSDGFPAALEPPAAIAILSEGGLQDGKEYVGRRISLDFKDVDVADVLRLIAEVSDLNVVAGDAVSGTVTIRLVDVPWDQALDVILLTKGLGFVRVGNVLRIAPNGVLAQEDELRLQERRNLEALEDLIVKLQPVNYADVGAVSGMVQKLLTPRGTVDTDKRTNTLIIKDIPTVVDEATALIKAIDTQTPQVMIEAKIVEASLDFNREFGSTWSFGAQPLVNGFDPGSGARTDLGGRDFRFHDENNFQFGNPVSGTSGVFNLAAFLIDEKMNLDLKLQAAESNGDGKVISSPRIVTLDNTKATIEQGVSIPFQTFENGDAQLEFVDAVLKLDVTPHITGDRRILMSLTVSRNAPDFGVPTLTGSPAIAKNQIKTETLVADGQTLVLGGIYVLDKTRSSGGVPFLKDIPIFGWAFKSLVVKDNRKELLMFVTPNIIESAPQAL